MADPNDHPGIFIRDLLMRPPLSLSSKKLFEKLNQNSAGLLSINQLAVDIMNGNESIDQDIADAIAQTVPDFVDKAKDQIEIDKEAQLKKTKNQTQIDAINSTATDAEAAVDAVGAASDDAAVWMQRQADFDAQ